MLPLWRPYRPSIFSGGDFVDLDFWLVFRIAQEIWDLFGHIKEGGSVVTVPAYPRPFSLTFLASISLSSHSRGFGVIGVLFLAVK